MKGNTRRRRSIHDDGGILANLTNIVGDENPSGKSGGPPRTLVLSLNRRLSLDESIAENELNSVTSASPKLQPKSLHVCKGWSSETNNSSDVSSLEESHSSDDDDDDSDDECSSVDCSGESESESRSENETSSVVHNNSSAGDDSISINDEDTHSEADDEVTTNEKAKRVIKKVKSQQKNTIPKSELENFIASTESDDGGSAQFDESDYDPSSDNETFTAEDSSEDSVLEADISDEVDEIRPARRNKSDTVTSTSSLNKSKAKLHARQRAIMDDSEMTENSESASRDCSYHEINEMNQSELTYLPERDIIDTENALRDGPFAPKLLNPTIPEKAMHDSELEVEAIFVEDDDDTFSDDEEEEDELIAEVVDDDCFDGNDSTLDNNYSEINETSILSNKGTENNNANEKGEFEANKFTKTKGYTVTDNCIDDSVSIQVFQAGQKEGGILESENATVESQSKSSKDSAEELFSKTNLVLLASERPEHQHPGIQADEEIRRYNILISPVIIKSKTLKLPAVIGDIQQSDEVQTDEAIYHLSQTPVRGKSTRPDEKVRRHGHVKRGKWILGVKIGVGAFGTVHVAMNTLTGTLMAVKSVKMEKSIMVDARREVELLKSLDHVNIVRYYGAEINSNYLHIFQEWVPAGSITLMLQKFGPFPIDVIRHYLQQTLQGLSYLHCNKIMHRDIKGSNILVSDDGIVKLADFGSSKRFSCLETNLMQTLTMRGTPYFMAPEVFKEKYSTKADTWSVGCVAHQMATGSPPWKDLGFTNPVSLFHHIQKIEKSPTFTLPEESNLCKSLDGKKKIDLFKGMVSLCFCTDPSSRPSAEEMLSSKFFTEQLLWIDREHSFSGSLFSPESTCSPASMKSHISPLLSPIPFPARRCNSIGYMRSPLLSPQLPRPILGSNTLNISPIIDSNGWPTWARNKLASGCNKPIRRDVTVADDENLTSLMGSLGFSDDSTPGLAGRKIYKPKQNNSEYSTSDSLDGLKFLDKS